MIKALIFDFDGLIIETEEPCYQARQEIYQSFGVTLDRKLYLTTIGSSSDHFNLYDHLEQLLGHPFDREAVRFQRRRRHRELADAQPLLPGVREYIRAAQALGLKLAIASSSSREWVTGHLARRGLLADFPVIKCSDDVTRTKPSPEVYLAALDGLGLSPAEVLAFEDSPNGVLAAKQAGIFCIAVPGPMTRALDYSRADLRLDSLAALPLSMLLEKLPEHLK